MEQEDEMRAKILCFNPHREDKRGYTLYACDDGKLKMLDKDSPVVS